MVIVFRYMYSDTYYQGRHFSFFQGGHLTDFLGGQNMKNTKFVGKNTKSHYFLKSGGANAPPPQMTSLHIITLCPQI